MLGDLLETLQWSSKCKYTLLVRIYGASRGDLILTTSIIYKFLLRLGFSRITRRVINDVTSQYRKGSGYAENVKAMVMGPLMIPWCGVYRMIAGQVKAANRFPSASSAIIHTFVLRGDNSLQSRHNKSSAYDENGHNRPQLANAALRCYICAPVSIKMLKYGSPIFSRL
jgi:hypothetical protein